MESFLNDPILNNQSHTNEELNNHTLSIPDDDWLWIANSFLIGSCSAAICFENAPWLIPLEVIQLAFPVELWILFNIIMQLWKYTQIILQNRD